MAGLSGIKHRLSCGVRPVAQTAANLVGHVIPYVPARHWMLALAIRIALSLALQPTLLTPVL